MNFKGMDHRIEYIILVASAYFVGASVSSGNYFQITASFFIWALGLTVLRLAQRKWDWHFRFFVYGFIIWTLVIAIVIAIAIG